MWHGSREPPRCNYFAVTWDTRKRAVGFRDLVSLALLAEVPEHARNSEQQGVSVAAEQTTAPGWGQVVSLVLRARDLKGWTNKTLADRSGVSVRTVGHLLEGRRDNYSPATLGRVERALGLEDGAIAGVAEGKRDVDELIAKADLPGRIARLEERLDRFEGENDQIRSRLEEVLARVDGRGSPPGDG